MNTYFKKALSKEKLGAGYIENLLDDIFKDQGVSLGAGLYKIRGARKGQGKSGGYRNIFYWKKGDRVVLTFLFPKGEMGNIDAKELKGLKILASEYKNLTDDEINKAIKKELLLEVEYDNAK